MAQDGYDELMQLTDSRYTLSMIAARRAAQIKSGLPSVLSADDYPATRNTVTVAMHELINTDKLVWGPDLPDEKAMKQVLEKDKREAETYSVSKRQTRDF
ncbi:MAG: DNA-directed RNA polymerase subunit omega [Deinococcota bacterium]